MGLYNPSYEVTPAAPTAGSYLYPKSDGAWYYRSTGGSETAFATLTSGVVPLSAGGTNAALTASNGGIVYSAAGALAILAGTATAGQIIRSGPSAAPSWSTATYPSTAGTAANVLRSDGTNFLSAALAAADLSNGTTGTGAVMLAASPTTTGTLTAAAITASGKLTVNTAGLDVFASLAAVNGLRIKDTSDTSGAGFVDFRKADGTVIGSITRVTTTDAVNYSTTSDQRLKSDLGIAIDTSVLHDLKIHNFAWKDSGHKSIGVFAQEAYQVYPDAISKGSDTDLSEPWQASYSAYVPHLIVGWQDHDRRLLELEQHF